MLALAAASACHTVASDDVDVGQIHPSFRAQYFGNHELLVRADLARGSATGTVVELGDGDAFYVHAAALRVALAPDPCRRAGTCLPIPPYLSLKATLPLAPTLNQTLRISLERDGRPLAANSRIEVPEQLRILTPTPEAFSAERPFSRSRDKVTVTWGPMGSTDHDVHVSVYNCRENLDFPLPTGATSFVLDASRLRPETVSAPACEISVRVSCNRQGTIDPAFTSGGAFTLGREAGLALPSVP
jgi:hypothetical protein